MKKVCVVTGTRAEYGLLKPLIRRIHEDSDLELLLYVTGMHLSPEFGLTYREIEEDGFPISQKIEMLLSADTPGSIIKSMGVEMIGLADAFTASKPDMVIILGDRYEMIPVAVTAVLHEIPVAHIHGGELTEGLIDESIRHSITKMSYLHFTTTETYRRRATQLGENPERVFCVGALGIENIHNKALLTQEILEKELHFIFREPTALVTFHPVTLEKSTAGQQIENLLEALLRIPEMKVIFTKANADTDGRIINETIEKFTETHKENCVCYASLGEKKYLSCLRYCTIVIGNSSSGIIEVPSFHIPTVNIGDRQNGRIRAKSVIDCNNDTDSIEDAIRLGLSKAFREKIQDIENPYEGKNPSLDILNVIKEHLQTGMNLKKQFYDVEF